MDCCAEHAGGVNDIDHVGADVFWTFAGEHEERSEENCLVFETGFVRGDSVQDRL